AVYKAMNEAGLDASASPEDIFEALVKMFAGDFTASGVTGAEMQWNDASEVNKTPNAMVIENGVYVPVK
ncbi:MAG: amino acid ABC transporter substrate-binding protein, partial [Mogibacterium sp.]|nr:amino acid ABC transporter substrate-binding protein [Mogibacterium sp.]